MIRPINNYIFVLPFDAPKETEGGIILAGQENKEPNTGTIVAAQDIMLAGCQAIWPAYAGTKIEYEGKTYHVLKTTDLIAIIDS